MAVRGRVCGGSVGRSLDVLFDNKMSVIPIILDESWRCFKKMVAAVLLTKLFPCVDFFYFLSKLL